MAIVTYCQIVTSTGVCTEKFQWDDTYTYTPPSGYSLAPNGNGEVGWTWTGTVWTYSTSTPASGSLNPFPPSGYLDYLAEQSLYAAGDVIYYDGGVSNLYRLPIGTTGQVLTVASGNPSWATQNGTITFIIDGGGSAITTGSKGDVTIPFDCTITQWTVLADQTGSIVIDVKAATYSTFPTATSIVGAGNKPTITSSTKGQATPSGWTTTTINAGDCLDFNVDSASTVTRVTLSLTITRN